MKEKIITLIKQPLIYIIIICIAVQTIIYMNIPQNMTFNDSASYINGAEEISVLQGKLSNSRTPIYPLFIKIIKAIGGEENLLNNIAFAQKFLFIITLILFYYCIKTITDNKIILSVLTLIFGTVPCIITWNAAILTESLAVMEMVILSLLTLKYLKKPNKIIAGIIGIVILVMILTRPIFIYLLPIYLLFWILEFFIQKDKKAETIIGIISCAICGIVLLLYCLLIQNQYGEFKLTTISDINIIMLSISNDSYLETNNEDIIQTINEIKNSSQKVSYFEAALMVKDKYSSEQIKEFISSVQKTNTYIKSIISKIFMMASKGIGTNYTDNNALNSLDTLFLPITFGLIYICMIIGIIYLIWKLIKTKEIDWVMSFCISVIVASLFTIIVRVTT